ncbi:hypothetical protein D0Z07_0891 [Hyphodiscus hymeniophilus]|uniref:DUF7918 domain-containing protein n=1 Tax=Hyphodiscus hymeniophilus TaxID=353542 RepID=A0A9P6VRI0_9HELO|nr:hypothetical protein D0Z07_0891 [Hyphodiscus hymeniophilus]
MAVLSTLRGVQGISVSVVTADSPDPLTEYLCDEDEEQIPEDWRHKTTTNWLQCTDTAEFSFKLNIDPPYRFDCPALAFVFILDGKDEGPREVCLRSYLKKGHWECIVAGFQMDNPETGERELHPFTFVDLKIKPPKHLHLSLG